jgi:hypothetical protein
MRLKKPDLKRFEKRLFAGLLVLALLSPIGIIAPRLLDSKDAWGEWSADTLKTMLGYIPEGLSKAAELWKAPVGDYQFWGEQASLPLQITSYLLSALIGIFVVAVIMVVIAKVAVRNGR